MNLPAILRAGPALLAAFVALFSSRPARATWYSENIENGADIIMMDLR